MMKAVVGVMAVAVLATRLAAQAPEAQPPGPRESPEAILRLRDELGLSEQQLQQLRTLRQQAVEERRAQMGEMMDLRSKLVAREITRDDFEKELTRIRDARRSKATTGRGAASQVLTEAQRTKLAEARLRGMRQRMIAMRRFGRGRFGRMGPWARSRSFGRFGAGFGRGGFGPGFRRGPRDGADGRNGGPPAMMQRRAPSPPDGQDKTGH